MNQEKINEPLSKTAVSGSLSTEDCKWLIFYGETKEGTVKLNDRTKHLDYAINTVFSILKEQTIFDSDGVEKMFWERIVELANYR